MTRFPISRRIQVIVIGASTGGTVVLENILSRLPEDTPGLLIAQHIQPGFSRALAERLNRVCRIQVKEAEQGDSVLPGRALIAPGNLHMVVRKRSAALEVGLHDGNPVCYQRPSVNVLFDSAAAALGRHAMGIVLTGMGSDGAHGLLAMREAGALTIAQDEATCVVYGMPREAVRLRAADRVLSVDAITACIARCARFAQTDVSSLRTDFSR
jgi:two-component system chemotaxis response regulator CheB